jgi:IstB-like ATP binding protein
MQFSLVSAAATVAKWHEQIGDPTIADGILDRLIHNAHHMELRGESTQNKNCPYRTRNRESFFSLTVLLKVEMRGIKGLKPDCYETLAKK